MAAAARATTDTSRATHDRAANTTLVTLAAVTWDFKLVGRSRMLAEAWHRVAQPTVFVEIPSYRSLLRRMFAGLRPRPEIPVVRPSPTLPASWWSPDDPERLERIARRRARALRRTLDKHIAWDNAVALVVSPVWAPWLDELPFQHVIYDCIDDLSVQTPRPELADLYQHWERRLLERCSGAVVSASPLADHIAALQPGIPLATIQNGVDASSFWQAGLSAARPRDLPDGKRPIIGFVGALYDWIDFDLIHAAATAMPECDFVLIGPHDGRGAIDRVSMLPNVHLLGRRPYEQVPAYMQAFDVCWVPFVHDNVALAANPVKIYEYLALGKPVVSSPVADTASFEDCVAVGTGSDEIIGLLREALATRDDLVKARIAFADRNSWNARAGAYVEFVKKLDGERTA